ncbi:MAG: MazG nucleotide pyrophosphohydrolase domain-containing protein [bacterium]
MSTGKKFEELVEIVAKLRRECPWDREQTFETLKPFLIEEVHEAIEAIDNKDYKHLAEEVGDMLLHVVMLGAIAAEKKHFKIDDVIEGIGAKMIRRHPHVFGKAKAKNSKEVLKLWEKIKKTEK